MVSTKHQFWEEGSMRLNLFLPSAAPSIQKRRNLSVTLRRQQSILIRLVFLLGALVPVLHATTILSGTLYFTTFQDQGAGLACNPATATSPGCPNVWKVPFVYDSVAGLCLGTSSPITTSTCPTESSPTPIKTLRGADGIVFDPNDPTNQTLLVGEQSANKVAKLKIDGTLLAERTADPSTTAGQAYSLTVSPGNSLMALPNNPTATQFDIDVLPLNPFGNGSAHPTNLSTFVKTVAFLGNVKSPAYWGDAKDGHYGFFGTLDLSTIGTPGSPFPIALSPIVDDVGATPTSPAGSQGMLPSHFLEFDSFSGCFIMSGKNQIWQVCPDPTTSGQFRIKAKIGIPHISGSGPFCTNPIGNPYCGFVNWDQTTVDGKGHLFAANNDGDVLFIDYRHSATKSIADPTNYAKMQFLSVALDDIVFAPAPPPPANGCPATKGFWHNHPFPKTSVTVGGVVYNGATGSMTIGGITYSQADVLSFLPTGSRAAAGGNGFRIGGSQLIAAILNIANGSPHTASLDATISAMNAELTGQDLRGPKPPNPLNSELINFGNTLDAYNSSASSLGCVEGTPAH